jgi:YHS domain-containing protein
MRLPLFGKSGSSTAKDPVCDMDVDMRKPNGGTHEHNGETYYFCCLGCRSRYEDDVAEALLAGDTTC